jgi:K+-sensing histidine kinase KdpD
MADESSNRNNQSPEARSQEAPSNLLPSKKPLLDAAKLNLLFNASKALASTTDLDHLLDVIVSEVRNVIDCEGAGLALYDEAQDDLYWRTVQDPQSLLSSARDEIRIPKDKGVGGWVFRTGKPALVHDYNNDPRAYSKVEDKSGFTTRNMICVPLKTREKPLGVLYALNKVDGPFTDEDVEILVALSGSVALALENASQYDNLRKSYEELERLNRVKNKILNHLSHELKTPLAIIEASLNILERRIKVEGLNPERFPFERILRNLGRLQTIEKQVGYIVEEKYYPERKMISAYLENLKELIEIQKEDDPRLGEAMDSLKLKIDEMFPEKTAEREGVAITAAFQAAEFRVKQMTEDRILDIEFVPPDPVIIKMQPQIMMAVIGGLVRNAVENTPDRGKIVVSGENTSSAYKITVRDYGVGIPESEQPNIFEGFYPVQELDLYSSGRRYGFNAGGTGTDLLKIKIFSERFGFTVRFRSQRCSCIPTVRHLCPGDISTCECCDSAEDCYTDGGTEFIVEIPPELVQSKGDQEAAA